MIVSYYPSGITIGVTFGVTRALCSASELQRSNVSSPTTVDCGAADRAASERMSSTTSTCNSECVQCTCAKDSALSIDQCWSMSIALQIRQRRGSACCPSFQLASTQSLSKSCSAATQAVAALQVCLSCIWKPRSALTHVCIIRGLVCLTSALHLHVPTSGSTLPSYLLLHTEHVCSHCWCALTKF